MAEDRLNIEDIEHGVLTGRIAQIRRAGNMVSMGVRSF